ncbi:hypothetical protein OnM2_021062 [Erysiphe neolycopersici]|uniref:Uncharacterized protein n=1 Tax=Erysiphe neolycopersici TaxID=212602 RepID=A0A420I377_9PEZI|nr:hypothetical protein OnM2_021062 [Erysiphe neolycopersici]
MPSRIESPRPEVSEPISHRKSILGRPRTKTGFSLRSSHSRKSSTSTSKVILHESHEEKEAHRLQSKADPSMAIVEVEPSEVASDTKTTIAPIRAIQHRDNYGNLITEPDRSNPTRNRWERPLDTIRSFEAAIDGSYSRKSQIRNDSNAMKRSSYYATGSSHPAQEERYRARPRSYYNPSPTPSVQYNSYELNGQNNNYYPSRTRNSRSEFYNSHTIYSVPDVQESYELVNSASGSGSSLDPNYSTGQSSENSSIDRVAPTLQKESSDNLSGKGEYDGPYERQKNSLQTQYNHTLVNEIPQAIPDLAVKSTSRAPIKLGNSTVSRILSTTRPKIEKRGSWLSWRLSRISRDHD